MELFAQVNMIIVYFNITNIYIQYIKGLSLRVLRADRIGYVTRIFRNKRLSISRSISKFGHN